MYVVVVVNEDDNEDDKGGCPGLGKDGNNTRDRRGNRVGGTSVDAGGGAGSGERGRCCSAG